MKEKVLIIGSGGREHALAKAFARSKRVEAVYVAPGNPGMMLQSSNHTLIECVPINHNEFNKLREFAQQTGISVTFVGPEVPLSEGIVDDFRSHHLAIVGPTQKAAQLEASKAFAKGFMTRAGVPTAAYCEFQPEQYSEAQAYLTTQTLPIVIKQDGLAAGKGVVIAQTEQEAQDTLRSMLVVQKTPVVIEEFLQGEEFSFFSLVNEEHVIPIGFARDYKRAYDHDEGLNTGGMGAFAPLKWISKELEEEVLATIVRPLIKQMKEEGFPYTGVLYSGLMQTAQGPKVIEFNARFGDPETQIVLPLLETDLYDIVEAHLNQSDIQIEIADDVSLGVVLAAEGYPQQNATGMPLQFEHNFPLEQVCFAGVGEDEQGQLIATGGRILMVTSRQQTIEACRQDVYRLLEQLKVPQTFYRHDIGKTSMGGE